MTVKDIYEEAEKQKAYRMMLFIEYLVNERMVISFYDDHTALDFYTQPKFRKKMIEYLAEYEAKQRANRLYS